MSRGYAPRGVCAQKRQILPEPACGAGTTKFAAQYATHTYYSFVFQTQVDAPLEVNVCGVRQEFFTSV